MVGRLVPLLESAVIPWRNRFLIEHPPAEGLPIGLNTPPYFAVRETDPLTQQTLVYGETLNNDGDLTDRELYDLDIDPFQIESVHREFSFPRFLQWLRLRGDMNDLETCGGGTCQAIEDRPID